MATTTTDEEDRPMGQTSTSLGVEENLGAALAYALGFLTGIIVLLLEQKNETVRFHAAQSIVVFGAIFVISIVLGMFGSGAGLLFGSGVGMGLAATGISLLLGLASFALWIASLVLWVYLIVRAYQGANPRIPGAAGIADGLV